MSTGCVPEFSSIPLDITLSPPVYDEVKGFFCTRRPEDFNKNFHLTLQIESEELS